MGHLLALHEQSPRPQGWLLRPGGFDPQVVQHPDSASLGSKESLLS